MGRASLLAVLAAGAGCAAAQNATLYLRGDAGWQLKVGVVDTTGVAWASYVVSAFGCYNWADGEQHGLQPFSKVAAHKPDRPC
jgi:hypothetical protein